jgi:undecaprenyl-diphosphatase
MFPFDQSLFYIFPNTSNIFIEKSFYIASWLFDPVQFAFLTLITGFLIYLKFGIKDFSLFIKTILLSVLVVWLFKFIFDVKRPIFHSITALGPSFPSAHSTVATAYFLMLLHFFKRDTNRLRRLLHYFFCILSILLVGSSRLYFGVHWLSDVLVGYLLGGIVVYIVLRCKHYGRHFRWKNS